MSSYFDDELDGVMSSASTEATNGGKKIEYPGNYLMKVVSKKYTAKDGTVYEFPNIKESGKGSLMLNFILEAKENVGKNEDGTYKVPAGSYQYGMLVIAPNPKSDLEKKQNTMKFLKPRLSALLGKDKMKEFKYDKKWVKENLLSEFKVEGDGFELVRDHNMTQDVMVEFVGDIYQGKPKLSINKISSAKDGDKSTVEGPSINDSGIDEDYESIEKLATESGEKSSGDQPFDVF